MKTTAENTNTLVITKEGRTIRVIDTTKGPRVLKVYFSGPFVDDPITVDQNNKPYWTVIVAYEDLKTPKYSYKIYDFGKAASLALKIAEDRDIELISEATDYQE